MDSRLAGVPEEFEKLSETLPRLCPSFPPCYSEQYAPLWLHELTCALSSCPDYKSFPSELSSETGAHTGARPRAFFHCTLAHTSKSNHSSHHLLVQVKPTQRLACRKITVAVRHTPPPPPSEQSFSFSLRYDSWLRLTSIP